jgi:hypothetical protein
MRLTYRGINYEPEMMPLEPTESEVAGKYRGKPWRYHYPRHIPKLQPKLWLQYRGVHYSKRPVVQSSSLTEIPIPAVTSQGELPSPRYFASQTKLTEAEQAHFESIRQNLEHRLSVARQNGNEQLVSMLEKEYQELALNH